MHNFKDYLNFSPNPADNAYRLKQLALQEALLAEAKKKKKKTKSKDELADKDYDGDGKLESKKKEYFGSKDKAIKANMAKKGKKIIEEATSPYAELEKHMSIISAHGRNLHDTDHPDRYKFGRAWVDFSNGKFDNADELIKLGADPEAIGNYIKIRTSPEYKEEMKKVQANLDPDFVMGRTITRPDGTKVAPGGWTGD